MMHKTTGKPADYQCTVDGLESVNEQNGTGGVLTGQNYQVTVCIPDPNENCITSQDSLLSSSLNLGGNGNTQDSANNNQGYFHRNEKHIASEINNSIVTDNHKLAANKEAHSSLENHNYTNGCQVNLKPVESQPSGTYVQPAIKRGSSIHYTHSVKHASVHTGSASRPSPQCVQNAKGSFPSCTQPPVSHTSALRPSQLNPSHSSPSHINPSHSSPPHSGPSIFTWLVVSLLLVLNLFSLYHIRCLQCDVTELQRLVEEHNVVFRRLTRVGTQESVQQSEDKPEHVVRPSIQRVVPSNQQVVTSNQNVAPSKPQFVPNNLQFITPSNEETQQRVAPSNQQADPSSQEKEQHVTLSNHNAQQRVVSSNQLVNRSNQQVATRNKEAVQSLWQSNKGNGLGGVTQTRTKREAVADTIAQEESRTNKVESQDGERKSRGSSRKGDKRVRHDRDREEPSGQGMKPVLGHFAGEDTNFQSSGHYSHWARADADFKGVTHIELEEGKARIDKTGVYLIYAQITFNDSRRDRIGFSIERERRGEEGEGQVLAKCVHALPTGTLIVHTCHTSLVTALREGDLVSLRNPQDYGLVESQQKTTYIHLPQFTFWGLVKLY